MNVYVYRLILKDHLRQENNWTEQEENIIKRHLSHFEEMTRNGTLLLAGKTAGLDDTTYGLCFFKAPSLEVATIMMNQDPAIKEGIMDGYLHEYSIAFFNKEFNA